ncbi:phage holin family protein [Ligilactobacillus equi]|uniref:Integral membrane protein n=2 Tax=Ligilactobacillus equi TaxID=137357 RepID=V7HZU4_9LACO|nr:phage holin family protein [Ligilactobacillus equi]ETA74733.1 hypothetical protein LEQ_0747 [Ligilactobacillus equi DPC 6820]KRL84985.1 hypothetical protein FC36_GL001641 [Ligilactobacillus equi DSM 15833 = JCM 10991]MCQ2556646.1 phage holin family protein [Ligilactobacillus sp.]
MSFIQRTLINAVIFIAVNGLFPNLFHVENLWYAFIAALVMGVLNAIVKPILVIIALPITFMTLGIFYLVINGFILQLTATIVGNGFAFQNFGAAFIVALIVSGVNLIITDYMTNRG